MTKSDTHELAWAAGFFDGEGNVRARWNAKRGRNLRGWRGISIQVGQKDRAVLDRFMEALGIGRVYGPNSHGMCSWEVGAREDVFRVRRLLSPWLGSVKQDQFDAAVVRYHDMEGSESNY